MTTRVSVSVLESDEPVTVRVQSYVGGAWRTDAEYPVSPDGTPAEFVLTDEQSIAVY